MSPSTKAVSAVEPGRMAPPLHVFSTRFAGGRSLALGLSDGRVLPIEIAFHDRGGGAVRRVDGDVQALEPLPIDPSGRAIEVLAHAAREDGSVTAAAVGPTQLVVVRSKEETSLLGETKREQSRSTLDLSTEGG